MSTKCTLSYDRENKLKYRLYQECYENDNVWLELEDVKDLAVTRCGDDVRFKVGIPVEIFRHMVEGWLRSEWGRNPSMDHYVESQEDFDNFLESAAEARKNRAGS